ncbi:MAG: glycosyltransferase [bacterium]|nr:glycosyltransferase [bacterium]
MSFVILNMSLFTSILIPVYNGEEVIGETLKSILSQDFSDFEILVCDDASTDKTLEVVKSFTDKRIKLFPNRQNLGYPRNLERCRKLATGEIIFLMGQDDILAKGSLKKTVEAFSLSPDIGAVTRPYFWFDKEISVPVRAKEQLNPDKNEIVNINDSPKKVITVFKTLDQLSGLAYRRAFMDLPFHEDIFPCHVYPFASIFKRHPVVFLKDYTVAVRIGTSQSRKISALYRKSPLETWVKMVETVFSERKFKNIRRYLIGDFIAKNYVGLVQIKNYGCFSWLLREIGFLIKYRPKNLFSLPFWFFAVGSVLTPARTLIPLVDRYKNSVNAKMIKPIKFDYSLKWK